MMTSPSDRVENIVGKGENAGYQHFLLFPQCFQKPSLSGKELNENQPELLLKVMNTTSHNAPFQELLLVFAIGKLMKINKSGEKKKTQIKQFPKLPQKKKTKLFFYFSLSL